MNRPTTAALAVAALAAIMVAGSASAGTLGATFGPATVYGTDPEPFVLVINRSNVPAAVVLSADGGWDFAERTFTLGVEQSRQIAVARIGEVDGRANMLLSEQGQTVIPGTVNGAVSLSIRLVRVRPFDWEPVIIGIVAALLALVVLAIVLRRVRPWELRIGRVR